MPLILYCIGKRPARSGKKQESCGELQIDQLVVPKLKELAKCPAAMGLDGKMSVGFEVHFEK